MDTSTKATTKNTAKPAVNTTATAKTTKENTAKATAPKATATKTADKTTVAKKPVVKNAPAKKTTAKKTTEKPAKKERKSRKGITRSFAAEVTASVNPVMESVNAFITNPATSEDALKMIRLELRKAVRATRSTINTRKSAKA